MLNKFKSANKKAVSRLLSRVRSESFDECWIWQGPIRADGYGRFSLNGVDTTAHRASFMLFHDVSLPADICVCHSCDVTQCVNPLHLWPGTRRENLIDCVMKGRHHEVSKKTCKNGHPFSETNTHFFIRKNRGFSVQRQCRVCNAEAHRKRRMRIGDAGLRP